MHGSYVSGRLHFTVSDHGIFSRDLQPPCKTTAPKSDLGYINLGASGSHEIEEKLNLEHNKHKHLIFFMHKLAPEDLRHEVPAVPAAQHQRVPAHVHHPEAFLHKKMMK